MSESKLTAALIQFHKDVDKIEKNARGNYGKFADLSNVLSIVTPALIKNGIVLTQTFLEDSLVTSLRHVSGEEISSCCHLVVSEGRNKTQEWGKAVTYTRRYQICSILGIVADMDMDGAMLDEPAKPDLAKPKSTPKPAAKNPKKSTPVTDPVNQPLTKDEVDFILGTLIDIRKDDVAKFEEIQKSFMDHFKIASDCRFSESITTHAHLSYLNERI